MELVVRIGNVEVYTVTTLENDHVIYIYKENDCIFHEIYHGALDAAVEDSLQKSCDIYTQEFVEAVAVTRISGDILTIGRNAETEELRQSWFQRIDGTKYFQHYYLSEQDFVENMILSTIAQAR